MRRALPVFSAMKPEQALVRQVMEWLAIKGIPHYRTRTSGSIVHSRGKIFFAHDRFFRTQRGMPDILAWWHGKAFAFELKAPNGRATPEQIAWIEQLNQHGVVAKIVWCLEGVMGCFQ